MPLKIDLKNPQATRKSQGLNQSDFWSPFGVTQSGGSRYENGRPIPVPTAMLMQLFFDGKVTEKDLAAAMKKVSKR